MIPQADLERAIDRWKVRQGGGVPEAEGFSNDATVVSDQEEIHPADSGMITVSDDELDRM